jgi:hypothetical protein
MAFKISDDKKWNDKRFRNLNKNEKLLYIYLWDSCDIAGFYKLEDIDRDCFVIGLSTEEFTDALKSLVTPKEGVNKVMTRGFVLRDGYVWISHYIKHNQKDFGKNKNPAQKGVYKYLINRESFLVEREFYDFCKELDVWEGVWYIPNLEPPKKTVIIKKKVEGPVSEKPIEEPVYKEPIEEPIMKRVASPFDEKIAQWKTHYFQKTHQMLHSVSEQQMIRMLKDTLPDEKDQLAAIDYAMGNNWAKINPELYKVYKEDKLKEPGAGGRLNKIESQHEEVNTYAKRWKEDLTR